MQGFNPVMVLLQFTTVILVIPSCISQHVPFIHPPVPGLPPNTDPTPPTSTPSSVGTTASTTPSGPHLLDHYIPPVMQALAYYIELLQYEPAHSTTIEPPFEGIEAEGGTTYTAPPFTTPLLGANMSTTTSRPWWQQQTKPPSTTSTMRPTTTTTKKTTTPWWQMSDKPSTPSTGWWQTSTTTKPPTDYTTRSTPVPWWMTKPTSSTTTKQPSTSTNFSWSSTAASTTTKKPTTSGSTPWWQSTKPTPTSSINPWIEVTTPFHKPGIFAPTPSFANWKPATPKPPGNHWKPGNNHAHSSGSTTRKNRPFTTTFKPFTTTTKRPLVTVPTKPSSTTVYTITFNNPLYTTRRPTTRYPTTKYPTTRYPTTKYPTTKYPTTSYTTTTTEKYNSNVNSIPPLSADSNFFEWFFQPKAKKYEPSYEYDTKLLDPLPAALIHDINNERYELPALLDKDNVNEFLRSYDDFFGRYVQIAGKKRIPPTKPYVEFLMLYDLLKRESKQLFLNKYEGYTERMLKDLAELSTRSAERQLHTLLTRLLIRKEVSRTDILNRIKSIIKDLENPNSVTAKAMRYIPTLQFVP